jgi:hypothetical protein
VLDLDPVSVLEQRVDFLESIKRIAELCNWSKTDTDDLKVYVNNRLITIDNILFDVYEKTGDYILGCSIWEDNMENLRHWLSLVFGVKIKYI